MKSAVAKKTAAAAEKKKKKDTTAKCAAATAADLRQKSGTQTGPEKGDVVPIQLVDVGGRRVPPVFGSGLPPVLGTGLPLALAYAHRALPVLGSGLPPVLRPGLLVLFLGWTSRRAFPEWGIRAGFGQTATSSTATPRQTKSPGPGTRREGFACVSVAASRGGVFTVPPDATVGFSKPTEMLCGLPLAGILFPVTWQPSVHAPARARLPAPSPTPARASSRDRRGLPPACFPQPRKRSVARAPRALPLF